MVKGEPTGTHNIIQIDNPVLIAEIDSLLREGREVEFTPMGNSMRPFIESGKDSVTLIRPNDIEVGDILLCRIDSEHFVLHRLIAINADRLTLMGDGNLQGTEQCSRADVIGKVVAIRRPDGSIRRPTKKQWWLKLLPIRRWLLYIHRRLKNESTFRFSAQTSR